MGSLTWADLYKYTRDWRLSSRLEHWLDTGVHHPETWLCWGGGSDPAKDKKYFAKARVPPPLRFPVPLISLVATSVDVRKHKRSGEWDGAGFNGGKTKQRPLLKHAGQHSRTGERKKCVCVCVAGGGRWRGGYCGSEAGQTVRRTLKASSVQIDKRSISRQHLNPSRCITWTLGSLDKKGANCDRDTYPEIGRRWVRVRGGGGGGGGGGRLLMCLSALMRSRLSAGTKKADFGVVGVATYIPTHLRSGRRFEEMEIGVKFHSVTTLARTNEKEFNLITFIVKESVAALFIWIQWWKSPALVKSSETGMSVTGIDMKIILNNNNLHL